MKKLLLSMSLLASSMAFAADELHLYNWNNYLTEATAKRFEQSCKCKLVQDYYGDNEEMLAKLAAGAKGYDIVVPTGFASRTRSTKPCATGWRMWTTPSTSSAPWQARTRTR